MRLSSQWLSYWPRSRAWEGSGCMNTEISRKNDRRPIDWSLLQWSALRISLHKLHAISSVFWLIICRVVAVTWREGGCKCDRKKAWGNSGCSSGNFKRKHSSRDLWHFLMDFSHTWSDDNDGEESIYTFASDGTFVQKSWLGLSRMMRDVQSFVAK